MRRVVTMVLAVAALLASGPVSMLHVHAFEGHDHPEHHHGPAAHSHEQADRHRHQDETPAAPRAQTLESCDPGEHVVPVVFSGVPPTAHQAPLADSAVVARVSPPDVAPCCATLSDVRAHSPPRLTDAPLRAPPVVRPA